MENYRAIDIVIRQGKLVAAVAAVAVLVVSGALLAGVTSWPFWVVVSICCAAAAGGLVLLLRDIARVIADTLIPLP